MLRPQHRHINRGFSMIELAVVMAIFGILLAVGLPAFSAYIQNAKIATTAKSIFTGLQLARGEAIRRNLSVEFLLTNSTVGSGMAANAEASTTGRNWLVRFADPTNAGALTLVEAKSWQEGSGQSGADSPTVGVRGSVASITFQGIGGTGTAATINVSNSAGGACAADSGPMRCQRIIVTAGGQVRLCDPKVDPTDLRDSRACPVT